MRRILALAVLAGALPLGMAGQGVVTAVVGPGNGSGRVARPVKPYSMTQKMTNERNYGDGLTSTTTTEIVTMRDSQGRIRSERETPPDGPVRYIRDGQVSRTATRQPQTRMINVYDPVGGLMLSWNTGNGGQPQVNVNHISPAVSPVPMARTSAGGGLRAAPPTPVKAAPAPDLGSDELTAEVHTEPLGTRAIQGVIAEGTRATTKYSAGVNGMSREFTMTVETWQSVDDRTVLERTTEDPRSGKQVTTLVSFTEGEPDAALFKAPEGYKRTGDAKADETAGKQ